MIEHQPEVIALWPHHREKQLRKGTRDGKGSCRKRARELEEVKDPKCEVTRGLDSEWKPQTSS